MFLRKSKSRTEVFVLLPDKPEKLMIPASKEGERMKIERNCGKNNIRTSVMKDSELEIDRDSNNNALKKGFSELMWVKPSQKCKITSQHRGIFDIINMGKNYEKYGSNGLHHETGDFGYNGDCSDQSLTSSDDFCKSPTRLSPKERKSVRFEDDLSDSISSTDGTVLPVSAKEADIDSQKKDEETLRPSGQQTRRLNSCSKQCREKSERHGLLTRKLWQNPLNVNRETSCPMDKNFICHQCDKTFKYQSNLRSHVKNIHSGALFRSGSQTNLHSIDDLLICDVCSLAFKYSVNLRAHKAGHTRNKLNATI